MAALDSFGKLSIILSHRAQYYGLFSLKSQAPSFNFIPLSIVTVSSTTLKLLIFGTHNLYIIKEGLFLC